MSKHDRDEGDAVGMLVILGVAAFAYDLVWYGGIVAVYL
jgi:hypothetical protein